MSTKRGQILSMWFLNGPKVILNKIKVALLDQSRNQRKQPDPEKQKKKKKSCDVEVTFLCWI